MADHDVYLGIPGITAFENYEHGRTVLYVVHDRETPETVHALRQLLIRRRAPFGRYDKIFVKSKSDPSAEWRS